MSVDPQTQRNRDLIDILYAMPVKEIALLPQEVVGNYLKAIQSEMRILAILDAVLPGKTSKMPS